MSIFNMSSVVKCGKTGTEEGLLYVYVHNKREMEFYRNAK